MKRPLIAINCSYDDEIDSPIRAEATLYMSYIQAVIEAGGLPLLVPPAIPQDAIENYAQRADGFLFSGGLDYPPTLYGQTPHEKVTEQTKERTETDVALMKLALASNKPILGICAGMQLANILKGGALIQHLDTAATHEPINMKQDSVHLVTLRPDARLHDIFGKVSLSVNSAHHQAVDPEHIGEGLKITALADDGVIEALELAEPTDRFFELVQWHPERILDAEHRQKLFSVFVAACHN